MRLPVEYRVRAATAVHRSAREDHWVGPNIQASFLGGIACRLCKAACNLVPTDIGKNLCRAACDRTVCR